MAKRKSSQPTSPSVEDMRRYEAESIVSDAVKNSPNFKKEVKRVMGELDGLHKTVRANVTKENRKK